MTRTHLLTGAGSGIGAAVAQALHERGDQLWLLARSEERAGELAQAWPGARTLVADLADPDSLEQVLRDRLPDTLDSLVQSAGVVEVVPLADSTRSGFAGTLAVNLASPAELTRLCLPALRAAGGQLVLVNSMSGQRASAGWSSYAASKFGLRGFADAVREEERAYGVRVTSVFPGRVATPMQEQVHAQEGKDYDPAAFATADAVAAAVLTALDLPASSEVAEVQVRPTGFR